MTLTELLSVTKYPIIPPGRCLIRSDSEEVLFNGFLDMTDILPLKDNNIEEIRCDQVIMRNMNASIVLYQLMMYNNMYSLSKLHLNNIKFERSCLTLINMLPSLEKLSITYCNVTDYDLESLDVNSRLSYLNVTGNTYIRNLGFLRMTPSLSYCDVSDTGIFDETLYHLTYLQQLKVLVMCETSISDKIIPTVKKLRSLKELDISDTQVSEDGFNYLRKHCKIRKLYHHSDSSESESLYE